MRSSIIIFLILFCAPFRAQEGFFQFIPGWKSVFTSEVNETYRTFGLDALSQFENFIVIDTYTGDGELIGLDSIRIDTCFAVDVFFGNSITIDQQQASISVRHFNCTNQDFVGGVIKTDLFENEFVSVLTTEDVLLEDIRTHYAINDSSILLMSFNLDTEALEAFTRIVLANNDGAVEWSQDFYCQIDFGCELIPWHILPTPDGGYLFTTIEAKLGSSPHENAYLIKTDSEGNMEWDMYPGDYDNYWIIPTWPVLADNGDILIAYSDRYEKIFPTEQSNDDNTLWLGRYGMDGSYISETPIIGFPTTNSDPERSHPYYPRGMELDEDGNLIVWGYTILTGILAKISQDGELIWRREYLHPLAAQNMGGEALMDTEVIGMNFASDGGYLLTGEFTSLFSGPVWPNGYQSAFLIKTDSMGCIEPGCDLVDDIEEYGPSTGSGSYLLELSPNPLPAGISTPLNVRLPEVLHNGGQARAEVEVLDCHGKLVMKESIQSLNIAEENIELHLDLPTGLYIIRLITEQGIFTGKVVKE